MSGREHLIEGAENGPLKELRPPAVKKIQETHGDHGALIAIELRAEDAAEELEEAVEAGVDSRGRARAEPRVSKIGKFCNKFCKFLVGSFSAVSKRNFARKYAFDSKCQALQDVHTFAPLPSQNFSKKSV